MLPCLVRLSVSAPASRSISSAGCLSLLSRRTRAVVVHYRAMTTTTTTSDTSNCDNNNNTTAESHYQGHSQDSYESAYFYSPGAYMEHLKGLVDTSLRLSAVAVDCDDADYDDDDDGNDDDETTTNKQRRERRRRRRLLDVGGGTGNFTKQLLALDPALEAVVIDPFLTSAEAETDNQEARIRFVAESAKAFASVAEAATTDDGKNDAWWRTDYDHVLLKEVVHHLHDRTAIFRGMRQGFRKDDHHENGSSSFNNLLVITRPQTDIDYPLWPEARNVWAQNQPSSEAIRRDLTDAGFSRVDETLHAYPCAIAWSAWQAMVKRRFWSTFSHFTDDELEKACHDMSTSLAHRIDAEGVIHFEDRLVFLTAWK